MAQSLSVPSKRPGGKVQQHETATEQNRGGLLNLEIGQNHVNDLIMRKIAAYFFLKVPFEGSSVRTQKEKNVILCFSTSLQVPNTDLKFRD